MIPKILHSVLNPLVIDKKIKIRWTVKQKRGEIEAVFEYLGYSVWGVVLFNTIPLKLAVIYRLTLTFPPLNKPPKILV